MTNQLEYELRMRIKDDESWPFRDEFANRSVSGRFILDASQRTHRVRDVGTCGGEVRIEAVYLFTLADDGVVNVRADLRLYEGTSTRSTDLDGRESFSFTIGAGRRESVARRVRNTEEGGDWANVTLVVTNTVFGSEACPIIDAKAAALGSDFTGDPRSGCESVTGGIRRRYRRCDIYYSESTGVHEVHGEIRRKYNRKGGPDSDLRLPVTDERSAPDGRGRFNHFSGNGSIYWHPTTGPMEVRGGIRGVWARQGWERNSDYGYPTMDEMRIGSDPGEWFSDFQNGVIYWEASAAADPAVASLSRARLRTAFRDLLESRIDDPRIDVQGVSIVGVSGTTYDFMRSGNRHVTFRVTGEIASGRRFVPDPDWWLELPISIEARPDPDASSDVEVFVVPAGRPRMHVDTPLGVGEDEANEQLRDVVTREFSREMRVTTVPAAAGLLSVKVMPDGGVSLYFRPDARGQFAATVAQQALNDLEL